jgi:hypothetical protein
MKKLYRYYPEFDNDEVLWYVHEEVTGHVVAEFFFEDDAMEYCKFLERGGGFAGFTPGFILRKMEINMNDAFSMKFSA